MAAECHVRFGLFQIGHLEKALKSTPGNNRRLRISSLHSRRKRRRTLGEALPGTSIPSQVLAMSDTHDATTPPTTGTGAPEREAGPDRVVAPVGEPQGDDVLATRPAVARHFTKVVAAGGDQGPIGELAAVLATGRLDRAALWAVFERHGAEREAWFRRQLLDLVLGYVDAALTDTDSLSAETLADVRALRSALHIADGEFMTLRAAELAAIMRGQLERILDDAVVTDAEELEQVDLQAAFGVGYDDYLLLTRTAFEAAYSALRDQEACAGSAEAIDDVRRKLAALEPVYRLATARQRTLGGLF